MAETILIDAILDHYRELLGCKDLNELKDTVNKLQSLLSTLE